MNRPDPNVYFREIQTKFSRLYSKILNQFDLTLPQFTLLALLHDGGNIPMREAGGHLHITKPAVTYLVDQLEKKGWVDRKKHQTDRRIFLLTATPKGSAVVKKIRAVIFPILGKSLAGFKPSQQELIRNFFTEVAGRLDAVLKEKGDL